MGDLGHLVAGKVLGYRRVRLTSQLPFDGLVYRLARLAYPAALDATLEAVVSAWEGAIGHAPLGIETSERAGGLDLTINLAGETVTARAVSHPDLPSIVASLRHPVSPSSQRLAS